MFNKTTRIILKCRLAIGTVAAVLSVSTGFMLPVYAAEDFSKNPFSVVVEQDVEQGSVNAYIQNILSSGTLGKGFFLDRGALLEYYEARGFEPRWVEDGEADQDARALFDRVTKSWQHGFNPKSYHLAELQALMTARSPVQLADLELVLTDSYVRLGRDLSGIRINPNDMDTHASFWKKPQDVRVLLSLLDQEGGAVDALETLTPKSQTYARLQEELQRLMLEPSSEYEKFLPIRMNGLLHPYERGDAVPAIKARLGIEDQSEEDPYLYSDKLAAAIVTFQRHHGIKPDGIIGNQTLELLNIGRAHKIKQIIANLERLRWVEESKPDKYVVVNIPSTTVWAVEDGKVSFEMPVIVGKSQRPTNSFVAEIHGVRFNPTWTVPPTIKKKDILPELRKNPAHLKEKGMELMVGQGDEQVTIDPEEVDWSMVSENDMRHFTMVQTPGAHNPLGQIRILMPNRYNIYLHDTNTPEYFDRASQALSSGCVRMREPEKMADFIMKERRGWSLERMQSLINSGKMSNLYLEKPIPVYMLYYTVWINDKGQVVYGRDLYGYDEKLIKKLANIDGIFNFVDNNSGKAI